MKDLKLKLQNIDDKVYLLNKKREVIVNKIQNETCEHRRIKKGGGGMWHDWPDYGYYTIWYECLDCKKYWESGSTPSTLREKLEKNIVEDTSK